MFYDSDGEEIYYQYIWHNDRNIRGCDIVLQSNSNSRNDIHNKTK